MGRQERNEILGRWRAALERRGPGRERGWSRTQQGPGEGKTSVARTRVGAEQEQGCWELGRGREMGEKTGQVAPTDSHGGAGWGSRFPRGLEVWGHWRGTTDPKLAALRLRKDT